MRDLLARLDGLRARLREIPQADERRLQELRIAILGRKNGALTAILKALPALDAEPARRRRGREHPQARFEAAIEARAGALDRADRALGDVDLTMPAARAGSAVCTR